VKAISSNAKPKSWRIIGQAIKTPDEAELARIGKELDRAGGVIKEDAEMTDAIHQVIRKYRAEKHRRK
jgi:hypothetical protein